MGETNIFKVLADSQRRDILIMLRNERLNAGEIAEKLQITPAALSYHLKLLKNADLISEYKEKNFVYYEINTTVFDELAPDTERGCLLARSEHFPQQEPVVIPGGPVQDGKQDIEIGRAHV